MKRQEFIDRVKTAQIEDGNWIYELLSLMGRTYEAGFICAIVDNLNRTHDFTQEDFREEIMDIADYGIWES